MLFRPILLAVSYANWPPLCLYPVNMQIICMWLWLLCPESCVSFSTDTNPSCLLAHFIAYFNPFALPCCYCCWCWDSPFFRLSAEQKQIMKSKQTSHNTNGNEFIMRDVFSVYSSCAAVCFLLFFSFFLMPVINFWAKANAYSHTQTHSYVGSKKAHTHIWNWLANN